MKKNLLIVILISILGILAFNYFSKADIRSENNQILSEIEMEKNVPNFYIDYKSSYRKRILHEGYEIYLEIKNISKHTTYKDFRVTINSIGNSGTIIKSEETIFYETLRPYEKKEFSFKTKEILQKYKFEIGSIKPLVIE